LPSFARLRFCDRDFFGSAGRAFGSRSFLCSFVGLSSFFSSRLTGWSASNFRPVRPDFRLVCRSAFGPSVLAIVSSAVRSSVCLLFFRFNFSTVQLRTFSPFGPTIVSSSFQPSAGLVLFRFGWLTVQRRTFSPFGPTIGRAASRLNAARPSGRICSRLTGVRLRSVTQEGG